MAIKVIAQRREVKLGKNPGMKFVMRPDPSPTGEGEWNSGGGNTGGDNGEGLDMG